MSSLDSPTKKYDKCLHTVSAEVVYIFFKLSEDKYLQIRHAYELVMRNLRFTETNNFDVHIGIMENAYSFLDARIILRNDLTRMRQQDMGVYGFKEEMNLTEDAVFKMLPVLLRAFNYVEEQDVRIRWNQIPTLQLHSNVPVTVTGIDIGPKAKRVLDALYEQVVEKGKRAPVKYGRGKMANFDQTVISDRPSEKSPYHIFDVLAAHEKWNIRNRIIR